MAFLRIGMRLTLTLALVSCVISASQAQYAAERLSNQYIELVVGQAGDAEDAGPGRGDSVPVAGRFGVGTVGGDPTTPADNFMAITAGYPDPWGVYTIIRINDEETIRYGDLENGSWLVVPEQSGNSFSTYSEYSLDDYPIVVSRRITLIRDMIRVQYDIANEDITTHQVGLATSIDAQYGLEQDIFFNDGGPYYTAQTGPITNERIFEGSDIPDVFYGFDRLPNFTYVTQTILRGHGATPPDWVITTNAAHSWGDFWEFYPIDSHTILQNSGLLLYWRERAIPPARKREPIVFYFGLGQTSGQYNFPATVALQTPFALRYEGQIGGGGSIIPDPFTIIGYVYNQNPDIPLQDVRVQIELPFGIQFDGDDPIIKTIGEIPPGGEGFATWRIRADGTEYGPLPVTLQATGFPMQTATVTRHINVPATERVALFANENRMLSVPFQPTGQTTIGQMFSGGHRWSPLDFTYLRIPNQTDIQPGRGFWYRTNVNMELDLSDVSPVPGSSTEPFLIPLQAGWNQIGTPHLYGVAWGRFRVVKDPADGTVSINEAVSRNWIRGALYRWDPTIGTQGQYVFSSSPKQMVMPWEGYWIRALQPVTLIVPPADAISGGINPPTGGGGGGGGVFPSSQASVQAESETEHMFQRQGLALIGDVGEWMIQMAAVGKHGEDTQNFLGQSPDARDGYDPLDIDKAPPAGSLSLSFVETDWGIDSGRYMQNIRGLGATASWMCEVISQGADQEVALKWSGLEALPRGTTLRLTDISTGRSMLLSRNQTYRFQAEDGQPRYFRIVSEMTRGRRSR